MRRVKMDVMGFISTYWLPLLITLVLGIILGWLFTGMPASRGRSQAQARVAELEGQASSAKRQMGDADTQMKQLQQQLAAQTSTNTAEVQQNTDLKAENERLQSALQAKDGDLQAKESALQAKESELQAKESELADALAKLAGPVRLFEQVSGVAPDSVSLDHLTAAKAPAIINALLGGMRPTLVANQQDMGILPHIGKASEQRLYDAGIGTYWEVANLSTDDLTSILKLSPVQKANMNVDELRSEALRLANEGENIAAIWNARRTDDFESIPGISGTFEQRLYNAGIHTYEELGACTVDQLSEICRAPSTMMPNYVAWIAVAKDKAEKRAAAAAAATPQAEA
jgi:predicted flap endonuclease-1-like 5' DNA nuclease